MTDSSAAIAGAPGAGARVLVVEDSATQAAALAVLLENAGYATVLARRGDRALELLEQERIDLVLSDVVMPVMDGYELCRRIKARPEWQGVPVVLLTSLTDPLAIVRGLASGADHYVTKPYDTDGLLARVRFVLHHVADPQRIVPAPVDVDLLGTKFTIRATKEQILELLVSSYSDLVRTSEVVREAEQRARFLAEATEVLSSTLDARKVLSDLARLSVPRIADLCATDVIALDGTRERVALVHAIPGAPAVIGLATPEQDALVDATIAEQQPQVVSIPDMAALRALTSDEGVLAALGGRGPQELIVVPLVARGRVLGIVQFVALAAARAARADEMPLILDLARRAALAVDNALLYEEAQRATRARDDVLAIVSHDLRNPINTIQMSTSFLLDVLAEPDAKNVPVIPQLQVMQRATRRANALIQDLLDVSRIDAGTLAVATTALEASMLIRDAVLELAPLVEGKKLVLEHEWSGPDLLVAVDRSRIGQIFSNLVGNAIKFTKAGGTVRIEGRRRGDAAEFDVVDSGAGIPPEHVPHLFDRFWQASQTSRSGAGLGLFIVKGIVAAHGGSITVESTVGEGTRFRFSIPSAVKH
ncbi:MAG TPA: ATP-binding protein [Gemmatimonadaceae bacterium]|nr:ATP-binding protein [Gemmatimonadaceae bacterium]